MTLRLAAIRVAKSCGYASGPGDLLPEVTDAEVVSYLLADIRRNTPIAPPDTATDVSWLADSIVYGYLSRRLTDRVINRALRIIGSEDSLRALVVAECEARLAGFDESPEGAVDDIEVGDFFKSLDGGVGSDLGVWLLKSVGAKYVRKVPTGKTTATGRMVYRYFYSDASAAHGAREGEHINTREGGVHEVVAADHAGVTLRHRDTGAIRTVTHDDLSRELADVYRERFERGAESLLRRYVAQVKPGTHAERFAAAMVPPEHAKRIVAFLAKRPGWEGEAKQALLSLASNPTIGRRVSANARQIARGAENLRNADGDKLVRATHVGEAVALRVPEGREFDERLDELRRQVAEEVGKAEGLLGAIEAAGSSEAAKRALVDFAHNMLGAAVAPALERMATAFPALRNLPELTKARALQVKWDALRAERAGARKPNGTKGIDGSATTVYIADAEGNPTPQRARYRLVEAGHAIASHDPTRAFKVREDYPEGVQERAYHRDKAEQDKVRTNARKLEPAYVVNTNPDAVNGPPVMTADGVVLGGNSRTMSLQLAYAEDAAASDKYRAFLKEHAHEFGLAHGDVDALKAPVLVRVVETPAAIKSDLGVLVRRYNESFTQGMDPRVDQVARGRMVTDGMLDTLAAGMDRTRDNGEPMFPTLNAYLGSSDGGRFVQELQSARDGKAIVDRRNRSQYVGKDGKLNEDGKTFVERVLVGHYLPDPDLLSEMLPKHVSAVSGAVPHLVRAGRNGHDLRGALRAALEAHNYMRRKDLASVNDYERDSGGFASLGVEGFESKPKLDTTSKKLLGVLVDRIDKPVQMAAFFRDFATFARRNPAGQGDLAGGTRSTADLIDLAAGRQGDSQGQLGMFKSLEMPRANALRLAPLYIPTEAELPDWLGELLWSAEGIEKAAGHKYVRRVASGNPKRPWRYYYKVTGGAGIAHDDEIKVGSAFKVKHSGNEGHFHVTAEHSDGSVTIKHDESGHEERVSKAALRAMVHAEHAEALGKAREKAAADLAQAKKTGSPAQVKAREAEAAKLGALAPAKSPQRARVESLMRSTLIQDRVSDRDRKLVTQVERLLGAVDSGSASYAQQIVDAIKTDGKPPRPMQQELRDEAFALVRDVMEKGGAEKAKAAAVQDKPRAALKSSQIFTSALDDRVVAEARKRFNPAKARAIDFVRGEVAGHMLQPMRAELDKVAGKWEKEAAKAGLTPAQIGSVGKKIRDAAPQQIGKPSGAGKMVGDELPNAVRSLNDAEASAAADAKAANAGSDKQARHWLEARAFQSASNVMKRFYNHFAEVSFRISDRIDAEGAFAKSLHLAPIPLRRHA